MNSRRPGTRLLLVGVDGLDYDVVIRLADQLPRLGQLVAPSTAHASTFPPDSVPSWTTIFTGTPPAAHGRLHSKNYVLDTGPGEEESGLSGGELDCFWSAVPKGMSMAVINPFLAYPPFQPVPGGAMVSAPSFSEGPPIVVDPAQRLVNTPPSRMGGFTTVPHQRNLEEFATSTQEVAAAQYAYTLQQLRTRVWDAVFHTNLTVDRIQHFAWRHFDTTDPTHPGDALGDVVPASYRQLDEFLREAESTLAEDAMIAVFSDHGHGPRASLGVNLQELFRRSGLYVIQNSSASRRALETIKTLLVSAAPLCHAEDPVIWVARRMPGKAALKTGAMAGNPSAGSIQVPDVAGSNPFGGVATGGDDRIADQVIEMLSALKYRGDPVARWVSHAEEILGQASPYYPEVLFEFSPRYAPTWNLYGPIFAPIITRRRLSGGHTRRGVFATNVSGVQAGDSQQIHAALRDLCGRL